ncbi:hypothetical protein [Allokutzneria sp. NRRL B-24872]|uniref:hypothetical protein n=1 Tax=Allokutzneria sp. NRRL B-24872 TaxID=1137961 RepID=UPI000A394068|nr:hypothetical protein [Allokutzneria sp. NRRL B-24872]
MPSSRTVIDLDGLATVFPHQVAKLSSLVALGISSPTAYRRCQPGGRWRTLFPGVLLLSSAPPTRAQLVQGALHFAGQDAMVSGHDALHLHGAFTTEAGGQVHLLVPHGRQLRGSSTLIVERTRRMPQPVLRKGFLTAPVPRALLDTLRAMRHPMAMRALLRETVLRYHLNPADLLCELSLGSTRGSAFPKRLLAELTDPRAVEFSPRRVVQLSGVPKPRWNVSVRDEGGDLIGWADAWWDDVGMAWRVVENSLAGLTGPELTRTGVIVVRTAKSHLLGDAADVAEELRRAYARAVRRPRPRVVAA